MEDISVLNKWKIRRRARRDVERDVVSRVAPYSAELSEMVRDEDQVDNIHSTLDAPYFAEQLSKFEVYRDNKLFQKKYRVLVYNQHGVRKQKKVRLMDAIAMLDDKIAGYRGKIDQQSIDSKLELDNCNEKYEKHLSRQEDHMVQMCVNQAAAIRANYSERVSPWYEAVTELYGQKVILLTEAKELSLARRAMHYRNIRYYAVCACEMEPNLGPAYIKDEDLEPRANVSLLGEYEEVLAEAIDQRDNFQQEYEQIESWK